MKVKICLIGKGIVGTSFLQLIKNKQDQFDQKFNLKIIVTSIFEYDGATFDIEWTQESGNGCVHRERIFF